MGAAKAALTRALQKIGCGSYARSRMSYGGSSDKPVGPSGAVEEAEDVIAVIHSFLFSKRIFFLDRLRR